MSLTLRRLDFKLRLSKVYEWGKLVSVTGSTQIIVQSISFTCGILIIRLLPTTEYAFYTLANTMLGTLTILADGGIATGVMALGGKVWKDRQKLGAVLITGLDLRKKFAIGSLLFALPVMLGLFRYHGASWLASLLIVGSIIPAFLSTLSGSLLQIAPKLQQDIVPLQRNQVEGNTIRLALLAITIFIFPMAFVALLAAGLTQVWANYRLRKICRGYVDLCQYPVPETRKEILVFVKRLMPGVIYYCISGQLTIWLISIFGSTLAVAQVGALSRLTMVLSVFSVMLNVLVVPRFARLPAERRLLLRHYFRISAYLLAISFCVVGMVWLFPFQVLWMLGPEYVGLNKELLLIMIGSCLNLVVGIHYALNSNRGWIMHPLTGIVMGIGGITAGIALVDVSTLQGVLIFNILTGVVGLFIHPLYGVYKIIRT